MPVADATSITFRPFRYFNYTTESQPEFFDLRSVPFRFHVDDAKSHFVRFYLFFDTSMLTTDEMKYIVILVLAFLSSIVF